jgi:hypothetical protein
MKRLLVIFVLTVSLLNSCTKNTPLPNNIINPPSTISYRLGDLGPSSFGRIVHVPDTQFPYYLESDTNMIYYTNWGCLGTLINYTLPQGNPMIGQSTPNGYENTLDIINQCPGRNAARVCHDTTINGKNDWYLPSMTEINWAYQAFEMGGTPQQLKLIIGGSRYWTSNQYDAVGAWVDYRTGDVNQRYHLGDKANALVYKVLAVRRFK